MTVCARQRPDLAGLQLVLLRLAETVDRAMISAQQAVFTHDMNEAARALATGGAIERRRVELEAEVHRLLAQQPAPLGADLRSVTAALVLAAELRQIGDCAHAIATIVVGGAALSQLSMPVECGQIAHLAREMLQEAMRAVVTRDASAAEQLQAANARVAALYQQVRRALVIPMHAQAGVSAAAADLVLIAHLLKSMAEHSVHIGQRAAFIATGAWLAPGAGGHPASDTDMRRVGTAR